MNLGGKERKLYLEKQRLINCGRCRYHRGENKNYHAPKPDKHKNIDRETIRKEVVMNEHEDGPAEEIEKELTDYYQRSFGMTEKEFNALADEAEFQRMMEMNLPGGCRYGKCDC